IEDNSDTRHNRPALWKKYGLPLALNAGDLLFEIALSAVAEADMINKKSGLRKVLSMSEQLFLGQHRDISFENRTDISESEYLQMVRGKTSALLGCSFALGAMAGGADEDTVMEFEYAGQRLGIAFQIRDDYLGTWGSLTDLGKSVSSDIMDKKNTMAVVYTADKDPEFLERWNRYDGNAAEVTEIASMMESAGAPEYLKEQCVRYTTEAVETISKHHADNVYQEILDELIASLVERNK
ncbi:MAG: polyprenyl synthetase family protein, partial [Anaerolineaceae bacterium]|nr:polyprenyl synthetase family protein [Anaerolineaceae bacterium]